jgi:hypothetical protein
MASYSIQKNEWSFEPSVFYARTGNFTSLQLQAMSAYKNKWLIGLSTSQNDPNDNWYSIIAGYRSSKFEGRVMLQSIRTDIASHQAPVHLGLSYYFGSEERNGSLF